MAIASALLFGGPDIRARAIFSGESGIGSGYRIDRGRPGPGFCFGSGESLVSGGFKPARVVSFSDHLALLPNDSTPCPRNLATRPTTCVSRPWL